MSSKGASAPTPLKKGEDLASEAIELIRRKNMKLHVVTGGKRWHCSISPRDEYLKSRSSSSTSVATTSTFSSNASSPTSSGTSTPVVEKQSAPFAH